MKNFQIEQNFSLQSYNSFGLNITCKFFAQVDRHQSLVDLLESPNYAQLDRLLLGGGSNILFVSDFPGLVIHFINRGISVCAEDSEYVWVVAAGGETWENLVDYTLQHNYAGIENLAGIPGTVGAAPVQNIGAYGVELKDVLVQVEGYDCTNKISKKFTQTDCQFGYRHSIFQQLPQYYIEQIVLKLNKKTTLQTQYNAIQEEIRKQGKHPCTITEMATLIRHIRNSRLPNPKILGNAGSFFKNPYISYQQYNKLKEQFPTIVAYPEYDQVKIAAGWLIEQCGFKGKRIGNVGTFQHQALIILNYGGARGTEILDFAHQIQSAVFQKFDIVLQPEVIIIGNAKN